jgi:AraC family transcriptional regulator of adaptative response/methylated-DNA-[protein]-cysteine methyltransferase
MRYIAVMPSDYARVAHALEWLAAHVEEQPTLERLADAAGVSPFHLQRVFTRWAGVSPKKFLGYLTLERARERLLDDASVLDAAHDAGLSGGGRLHDLCVSYESATPGEIRTHGAGLEIRHGFAPSPFGDCLVMETPRGLCAMAFCEPDERDACFEQTRARFRNARFVRDDAGAARTSRAAFAGERSATPRLELFGTPFQIKVWEALLRIPEGACASYASIAAAIGEKNAVRAAARAIADNPIAYLIPCHRVIRKTGAIHAYRWGRTRKLALLAWEAARAERGELGRTQPNCTERLVNEP